MVRISIQRLNDKHNSPRGPQRKGVLLAWPETRASILVVLADRREMKTSAVERILASGDFALFAKTRNSTYRIVCEPGDEASWARLRGDPVPIAVAVPDETSPEWLSQRSVHDSRDGRKR